MKDIKNDSNEILYIVMSLSSVRRVQNTCEDANIDLHWRRISCCVGKFKNLGHLYAALFYNDTWAAREQ